MNRNQKRLMRVLIGAAVFVVALLLGAANPWVQLAFFAAAYIITGGDVVYKAVRNIARGKIFDENFLMLIATLGAFAIGEYMEAVAVMLFYQVGELFQGYAVDQSRKSIANLMDIRPDFANVVRDGATLQVDPNEVLLGESIQILPGERIPLDGTVLEGSSMIDTSALTGESVPRKAHVGDSVLSGCINTSGLLLVKVEKSFGESTVSRVLDLVENASSKKARAESFITRFARYYTPAVVGAAVLLAVIPPLFVPGAQWMDWIYRALTFLVISCPCALVISVPLAYFGGIGGAAKLGVLVKGGNYLEALAKTDTIVFDKTGTLTQGVFAVQEIHALGMDEGALLQLAAYGESYSTHPIAQSLRDAYGQSIDTDRVKDVQEVSGHGLKATVDGRAIALGNAKMMRLEGVQDIVQPDAVGTTVHVLVDGRYAGYILIADRLKEGAKAALAELHKVGVRHTVMLTGDAQTVATRVAADLGIERVYAELLPQDKVQKVEELLAQRTNGKALAFVGDGINDAPVLARADVGIAMGALGSDAAIEAADVVLMTDDLARIPTAVKIARRTVRIARQNVVFALAVKAVVLLLGAMGIASMWAAVFADVGVAVLAILNAMRVLRVNRFL